MANTKFFEALDTTKAIKGDNKPKDRIKELKKPKTSVDDKYKYVTFMVERELAAEIDSVVNAANLRGFKTSFINQAIDEFLDKHYR